MTCVTYQDLEAAVDWTSMSGAFENTALISRQSGKVYFRSQDDDSEDELPEDIDDETIYMTVPDRNDLDLGRELVFSFTKWSLPQCMPLVESYFRQRGAYSKFKALLERESMLEAWFTFESEAKQQALLRWAEANEFSVTEVPGDAQP